ncbi:unnamed protein product, partial [Mesocestoides corti]|uniref:NTR domain-containing protein n=1 Tax=Mesocestoides corti TaxID=53468 RepID=A0A0R3UQX9_MESCO
MRTALWSILVLLCFFTGEISGCARRAPTSIDDSNTIHTFLPKYLFIDIPNRLIVHSSKPLTKITVNMIAFEQSSDDIGLTVFNNLEPTTIINSLRGHIKYVYNLKYLVPIEMEPGSPFNLLLNYFYCPEGGCRETEDETKITMVKTVQFMKHFTIIMGETDKPMYRPGDKIRFRFVALSSRQIVPYSGSLTWPEYRAVGSSWNDKYLEEIGEHERDRRMKPP